ncbi:hypothetical protein [Gilvimarinus polysaccharolyticus]|uniref:hypothetical protein n=1 Tax=Gilvimarinus polysaccharolyticus TaxID=863921 RepID=UPI0006732CC2|nr:hypothetical protein [Gilvimarinus polysaccharolyticus]
MIIYRMIKHTLILVAASVCLVSCVNKPQHASVTLIHGVDESAGGLPAYIVKIRNATFYLEKTGGGLSSMLDSDGVDWIGFSNEAGSGWKGEYRGFPNAIHKQDGNYFHAMNANTDKSSSIVKINTDDHVRIVFTSANGKWQGRWDFYSDRCDFTMTKVSPGHKYWIQYEGVPGGEMDDEDYWYNSASSAKHSINESFKGDLPAPEWYAFGDANSSRVLFMLHHEDDKNPDDYVSRPDMTVLGFGRRDKNKYITEPNTFSIGFIETIDYLTIDRSIKQIVE